ncbi:chemotaxis protein CheW [Methylomagnum sp.]
MSRATAWMLPITKAMSAAVGEFELVHILLDRPVLFDVPRAPAHCRHVLVWQDRIVPLMDLGARFGAPGRNPGPIAEAGVIGIVAYQPVATDHFEYGALRLEAIPWRSEVADEQACAFPSWLEVWRPYASACFQPEGPRSAVPILRLDRLLSS